MNQNTKLPTGIHPLLWVCIIAGLIAWASDKVTITYTTEEAQAELYYRKYTDSVLRSASGLAGVELNDNARTKLQVGLDNCMKLNFSAYQRLDTVVNKKP